LECLEGVGEVGGVAARYGLNHKTVAKWHKRAFVNDAPMGPKTPHSTAERGACNYMPHERVMALGGLPIAAGLLALRSDAKTR
jgi:hypothetical protein